MQWRIIGLETHDACTNMGIDESIMDAVRDKKANPTIRFYRWNPSAVSIGRFQSMEKEVNVQRCKELGIDCVRRITGGGAVFHDFNGEITYSVIAPLRLFPQGIRESYRFVCGWVISGLKEIGLDASFEPINDITLEGKKISGNAQTRKQGVLLQHGTVLYDLDLKTMFSALNVSAAKISDKMIKSAEDRVTSVREHSNIPINGLYDALLKGFAKDKDFEFGKLSDEESRRAEELARTTYHTKEWNFSR
jgi:lipoate---protein ligase